MLICKSYRLLILFTLFSCHIIYGVTDPNSVNRIVATVNNKPVFHDEIEVDPSEIGLGSSLFNASYAYTPNRIDLLTKRVHEVIISEISSSLNISVTDQEIETELNRIYNNYKIELDKSPDELKSNPLSFNEFKNHCINSSKTYLLQSKIYEHFYKEKMPDMKFYYTNLGYYYSIPSFIAYLNLYDGFNIKIAPLYKHDYKEELGNSSIEKHIGFLSPSQYFNIALYFCGFMIITLILEIVTCFIYLVQLKPIEYKPSYMKKEKADNRGRMLSIWGYTIIITAIVTIISIVLTGNYAVFFTHTREEISEFIPKYYLVGLWICIGLALMPVIHQGYYVNKVTGKYVRSATSIEVEKHLKSEKRKRYKGFGGKIKYYFFSLLSLLVALTVILILYGTFVGLKLVLF